MLSSFSVVAAGTAVATLVWLLMRPVLKGTPGPPLLPTMPLVWRLSWPWLDAMAPTCASFLSWRLRGELSRWLAQAGVPAAFTAAHAAAVAACAALLGAVTGAAIGVASGSSMAGTGMAALAGALVLAGWPMAWIRQRVRARRLRIARDLPFVLDMMTLCVESGLALQGALQQAEQHGPAGPLQLELARALSDMRAGMPRAQALTAMAERTCLPSIRSWTAALNQADSLGMSLGAVLRGHAAQCRSDRHQRAEKLAMEAPVKMLLPLIGCIFPCTFIVLAFPIAVQLWQAMQ